MWAKVDDGWWCHPKVMALPLDARGLWISALSWSCAQRTSIVPKHLLAMLGADDTLAGVLVEAGLWNEHPDGWEVHDWAEYQEMTKSEKRAEAGRKGGLASGLSRQPKQNEANAKQNPDASEANGRLLDEANGEAGTRPGPTRPNPPPTEEEDPETWNLLRHDLGQDLARRLDTDPAGHRRLKRALAAAVTGGWPRPDVSAALTAGRLPAPGNGSVTACLVTRAEALASSDPPAPRLNLLDCPDCQGELWLEVTGNTAQICAHPRLAATAG